MMNAMSTALRSGAGLLAAGSVLATSLLGVAPASAQQPGQPIIGIGIGAETGDILRFDAEVDQRGRFKA